MNLIKLAHRHLNNHTLSCWRLVSRGLTLGVLGFLPVQVLLSQLTSQAIFIHVLQGSNHLLPGWILFFAQPLFKHLYSPPPCVLVIAFDLSYLALAEFQVRSECVPFHIFQLSHEKAGFKTFCFVQLRHD